MTFRLVGLMSLVLLLSLAAFAYLMGSYQVGVMHQVNRTVSAVGKATLSSFEYHIDDSKGSKGTVTPPGSVPSRQEEISYDVRAVTPSGETISTTGEGAGARAGAVATASDAGGASSSAAANASEAAADAKALPPGTICPEVCLTAAGTEVRPPAGVIRKVFRLSTHNPGDAAKGAASNEAKDVVMIQIENVRAESDPARGTVLKIPT